MAANTPNFQYEVRASNRVTAEQDPKTQQDTEARDKQLEDYLGKLQKQVNAGGGGGSGISKVVLGAAVLDKTTGLPFVPDTPGVPQIQDPDWASGGLYDPSGVYNATTNTFDIPAGAVCQVSLGYVILADVAPSIPGDFLSFYDSGGSGLSIIDFITPGLDNTMPAMSGGYRDARSFGFISGGAHHPTITTSTQGWTLSNLIYVILWA